MKTSCIYEVGLEAAPALTIQEFHSSNIARNKGSGYRIVANKNKYMGKVLPLEESYYLKEAKFSLSRLWEAMEEDFVDWMKVVSWTDLISLS